VFATERVFGSFASKELPQRNFSSICFSQSRFRSIASFCFFRQVQLGTELNKPGFLIDLQAKGAGGFSSEGQDNLFLIELL